MRWFGRKTMAEEKKNEAAEAGKPAESAAPVDAESSPRPASEATESAAPETPKSAAEFAEEAKGDAPAAEPPKPAEPDWKDRYARLLADFDNFKKRTARDREDTYRFAEADILRDILPTVDNLALALANAKNPDDEFVKGVKLVHETLLKALKEHGAEPFDTVGQPLDTEKMEAIATLPSAEVAEGLVSNEAKRGWMLKDKVLRAAQVVVSSGAPG